MVKIKGDIQSLLSLLKTRIMKIRGRNEDHSQAWKKFASRITQLESWKVESNRRLGAQVRIHFSFVWFDLYLVE